MSLGKTTCSYATFVVSKHNRFPHLTLGRQFLDGVAKFAGALLPSRDILLAR